MTIGEDAINEREFCGFKVNSCFVALCESITKSSIHQRRNREEQLQLQAIAKAIIIIELSSFPTSLLRFHSPLSRGAPTCRRNSSYDRRTQLQQSRCEPYMCSQQSDANKQIESLNAARKRHMPIGGGSMRWKHIIIINHCWWE